MIYRTCLAAILGLTLTACSSNPKPNERGGQRSGPNATEMDGAAIARPMALVLTGLASDLDGNIEIAAIPDAARKQFARFDENASGALSAIEYARWAEAILGDAYSRPTLRMMDRNNDNQVSDAEFEAAMMMAAERYDADGNGLIERSELLLRLERRQSRGGNRGQGGSGQRGSGERPQRPRG